MRCRAIGRRRWRPAATTSIPNQWSCLGCSAKSARWRRREAHRERRRRRAAVVVAAHPNLAETVVDQCDHGRTQAPQRYVLPHLKIFLQKRVPQKGYPPFGEAETVFGQVFGRGGMSNF